MIKLDIIAVKQLIKENFRNNQAFFAETIKIDKHYLNRILRGAEKASSPKACYGVINYCKNNGLDYTKFIVID